MGKTLVILLSLILLYAKFACADIIYLKNGKSIRGEIVENNNEFVKINRLGLGMYVKYKQSAIAKIDFQDNLPATAKAIPVDSKHKSVAAAIDPNVSQTISEQGYFLYLPSGLTEGKTYPLIIVFDPAGNGRASIDFWQPIAEEKKLIIYASNKFRNGSENWFKPEEEMIESVLTRYPVDRKRIITTGISGGGMGAHMFAFYRPDIVKAVIITVGRINPFFKTDPKARKEYPQNKTAVFLAGTEDFNYRQMREDQQFLNSIYWKTKWLEFNGGHTMAPQELYKQAVSWIEKF